MTQAQEDPRYYINGSFLRGCQNLRSDGWTIIKDQKILRIRAGQFSCDHCTWKYHDVTNAQY